MFFSYIWSVGIKSIFILWWHITWRRSNAWCVVMMGSSDSPWSYRYSRRKMMRKRDPLTDLWSRRKDQIWIGLYQNIVETCLRNIFMVGMYIALKLIEYHSLGEYSCKLYIYGLLDCSGFIWISEACWILLWFLYNQLVLN